MDENKLRRLLQEGATVRWDMIDPSRQREGMMDATRNNGGASAPPTVLPFPQTKRALRHYRSGMDAAGFLSLLLLERDGEAIPANVQRFDEPDGASLPDRMPELLLAVLIWSGLPTKQRDRIQYIVRGMAYAEHPDPRAARLNTR